MAGAPKTLEANAGRPSAEIALTPALSRGERGLGAVLLSGLSVAGQERGCLAPVKEQEQQQPGCAGLLGWRNLGKRRLAGASRLG